jgi:hypothetical protein
MWWRTGNQKGKRETEEKGFAPVVEKGGRKEPHIVV